MSKKKKYRLKRKAWIEPEMIESEVFRTLPRTAMWVYLRFTQKPVWHDSKIGGRKNRVYETDGLTFTYSEANHFDLSNATFYRAVKILVERGFLDVEHRGGTFGHGEIKDYTRFKLSDRWKAWGTDSFKHKDFERLRYKGTGVQSRVKAKNSEKWCNPNCSNKKGSHCDYAEKPLKDLNECPLPF